MSVRAYCVDKIRSIEERAIAIEGVDPLMQRAAAAVAASASDLLLSANGWLVGAYGLPPSSASALHTRPATPL